MKSEQKVFYFLFIIGVFY